MKHGRLALVIDHGVDPRPALEPDLLRLASENAYPIVASRSVRKDRLGPAAGALGALLLGGVTFFSMASHRTHPAHPVPAHLGEEAATAAPAAPFGEPDMGSTAKPTGDIAALSPDALPTTPDMIPAATEAAADTSRTAGAAQAANGLRGGWSPMLVLDDAPAPAPGAAPDKPAAPPAAVTSDADAVSATRMADPANTVSQGTLIPAVLETAIDSDLPGYARALVTQDVRSFDRSHVLIPRSSRLIGEYKSGLADGQKRVYVTWTRLVRPDGVSIAIASPATSPAGGTGLSGQVNSHFVQRFGSAILLSVVGAASAVGGSGLIIAGSQSAASVAASHDATIPPTVRVRPGQPLRVFTARDLDFSTVAGPGA